jgi:uncharacterized protein (TIGR02444 family)
MSQGSPFWTFSLATYARPGVSEACLELQETAGVDVNVLLYLLWLGAHGRRLGRAEVAAAAALTEAWRRELVGPLRQARRASKQSPAGFDAGAVAGLRLQIKRAELEAERLQQEALYAQRPIGELGEPSEPSDAAAANVDLYAASLAVHVPEAPRARIIAAALSSLSRQGAAS